MNNTLTDLKRLLDEGETITDGYRTMWKAPFPNQYTINHNLSTVTLDWDDILYLVAPDPSKWHQRDIIYAGHTLESLHQILNNGGVLTDRFKNIIKKHPDGKQYYYNTELMWWAELKSDMGNPSEWSELKPEKPVMMAVPIEQWDSCRKN